MMQSKPRLHVALVMDGNGRWASRQGLPRAIGHQAGARTLRRIVEVAPGLNVGVLTVYAFSSDNWRRPAAEVGALMELFGRYFDSEAARCRQYGIRLVVIGRRDRLPAPVVSSITAAEADTAAGREMTLRVALDYSARQAIHRAALALARAQSGEGSFERFGELVQEVDGGCPVVPPVDLLVRTGGEQRLSDFLLWECAYAELVFRPEMWPEFAPGDFAQCIAEFSRRERRFGGAEAPRAEAPRRLLNLIR
jgi:undecaprenyl diphosphate synthase